MSTLTLRGEALKRAAYRHRKNRNNNRSRQKRHGVAGGLRSMHCGPGFPKNIPRRSQHGITLPCIR